MFAYFSLFKMCIIGYGYGALALEESDSEVVLNTHNAFRSNLALGKILNKDKIPLPSGENIYQLSTDKSLETIAQNWADNCVFAHSPPNLRNNAGENLYYTTANFTTAKLLKEASILWWKEISDIGINPNLQLTIAEFNRGVGHWTQMAWGSTQRLGCGVRYCSNTGFNLVVCNYFPPGNFIDSLIYESGKPCTSDAECTIEQNSTCNVSLGLCHI